MNSEIDIIKDNLRGLIKDTIIFRIFDDLIRDRKKDKKNKNKRPYTLKQYENFVQNHTQNIKDCVDEIYNDYEKNNKLRDLLIPNNESVWLDEYLYKYISYPN